MNRLLIRLGIGLLFTIFALLNYWGNVSENPVTGEMQRIQISPRQERVLGLESREQIFRQYGGLYPDRSLQAYVDKVGDRLIENSSASKSPYPFNFYLLRDTITINAFALPGGQIFITTALLSRLTSEAQLAGVLGHEIGHVVARHGAEHLSKQQLGLALVNAVGVAASDRPETSRQAAILAQAVNEILTLKYGRDDELESDLLGFRFMVEAGYSPMGLVELMNILASARGDSQLPEFFSTHPNPKNRIEKLKQIIAKNYPSGIPRELEEGTETFNQVVSPRL
ncbi:MAG: M48 family metallopeptidase [Xenococcaceae cyanobacterium MO_188.B29]|nr:M48 family metallopeptidase [Xenococcaceae cyanobacterium MO_188.B29]